MKPLLLCALLAVQTGAYAQGLVQVKEQPQVKGEAQTQVQETKSLLMQKCESRVRKSVKQGEAVNCILVKCKDAENVASIVKKDGYQAMVITSTLLTARVPASEVSKLSALQEVEHIQASETYNGLMDKVRPEIGADKVQAGEGLETPYTGKGVLVGVIDQGFEYRHLAFLDKDGQPRVKAVWDRTGYSEGKSGDPTTTIPFQGDNLGSDGHATHVTGIAAGSKITENEYYGVAPDADIIMIPSTFNSNEVLEDVQYIDQYAKEHQQPWVINMSFGSTMGSHDGEDYSSKALNEIVSSGTGHQIVVAGGNSGYDKVHATHTFTKEGEVARYIYTTGSYGVYGQIWCETADSTRHINVKPFIYTNGERDYQESVDWSYYMMEDIAPYNKKQYYTVGITKDELSGLQLGVEITADPGTTIHLWNSSYYGTIADAVSDEYLSGDLNSSLSGGAACADDLVTVASYVTRNGFTNQSGQSYTTDYGETGDISGFSSHGPSLSKEPKPTVAAPGSMVISAISKYNSGFSASSSLVVQDIKRGLRHFYYAANAGTSMAAPVVTGTIALWLQANPNLTAKQISNIIKTTSRKDSFTGDEEWNKDFGYGKIDAYEGLKKALELGDATGIPSVYDTEAPVSIQREADSWRILFNSYEHEAEVNIYDANGRKISTRRFADIARGEEKIIDFSSLPKGVYIIQIKTPKSIITRKIL